MLNIILMSFYFMNDDFLILQKAGMENMAFVFLNHYLDISEVRIVSVDALI